MATVLIVEDEEHLRVTLDYNLRKAGYNSGFTPLEKAVERYVTAFLAKPDRYR